MRPLPGLLKASFRGIPFFVDDRLTHEAGRRISTTIFPGIDPDADDDFGLHNGQIEIRGFLYGSDYKEQEKRLRRAFEKPGPGTLVHPWLGELTVILTEPGHFTFSERELRVCRFEATFKKSYDQAGLLGGLFSAFAVFAAVSAVLSAAQNLFHTFMSARNLAAASFAAGRDRADATAQSLFDKAVLSKGSARFEAGFETSKKVFRSAIENASTSEAKGLASAFVALPSALASAAAAPPEPAVGKGPDAERPEAPGERVGLDVLLFFAHDLSSDDDSVDTTERSAIAAAHGAALAEAARLAVEIDYTTRQEAQDVLNTLFYQLDAAALRAVKLAALDAAPAAALLSALDALRAALSADMNEIIGRLPAVETRALPRPVSAWLVATDIYGDDPASIVGGIDDLVMRNRPRHPGSLSGEIEVKR